MLKIRNITFIAALVLLCNGLIAQKAKRKTVPQKKKAEVTATTSIDKVPVVKEEPKDELKWYGFEEGYKKAVKEKKILLVDAYTEWCGWCKVMDRETYAKIDIILKLNKYFVAVKFNPENAAIHKINDQELSSDAFLSLLCNGGRNSGYPTTYFWKELTDNSKASAYPGYREPTGFNDILNTWINK